MTTRWTAHRGPGESWVVQTESGFEVCTLRQSGVNAMYDAQAIVRDHNEAQGLREALEKIIALPLANEPYPQTIMKKMVEIAESVVHASGKE